MSNIYADVLNVYKLYSELISASIVRVDPRVQVEFGEGDANGEARGAPPD